MFKKLFAEKENRAEPKLNVVRNLMQNLGSVFLDWLGQILNMWEGLVIDLSDEAKPAPKPENKKTAQKTIDGVYQKQLEKLGKSKSKPEIFDNALEIVSSKKQISRKDFLNFGLKTAEAAVATSFLGWLVACSSTKRTQFPFMPGFSYGSENIFKWGGFQVIDSGNNFISGTFAADSGFGFLLQKLISQTGTMPSTLSVNVGTFPTAFTIAIQDERAYTLSSTAAKENRNMTPAEKTEFNQHVKYAVFSKGASGDITVRLEAGTFKSFDNIFDHTENASDPFNSFVDLVLNPDGTFQTKNTLDSTTGVIKSTLGAYISRTGTSVSSVSGVINQGSLPANGHVYYVVEDISGNKEICELTGFVNGTYTRVPGDFHPDDNVDDNLVNSYSITVPGGLKFDIANKGYISVKRSSSIAVAGTNQVQFDLNLTTGNPANLTALIQDENGDSASKLGLSNGANSYQANLFLDYARSLTAGTTTTRVDRYTSDVLLKKDTGSTAAFYLKNQEALNSSSRYIFRVVIPDTGDRSALNKITFKAFNANGTAGNLLEGTLANNYIVSETITGGYRYIDYSIPNGDLWGQPVTNLSNIQLINGGTAADINLTFQNLQVDRTGSGDYSGLAPLHMDRTKVNKFALYNSTGTQIIGGNATTSGIENIMINGNAFLASQQPDVDWNNITKIMVITENATVGSTTSFKLNTPAFTPLEYGTQWGIGCADDDTVAVTVSADSGTMSFRINSSYVVFP